jgi:tyrosinase
VTVTVELDLPPGDSADDIARADLTFYELDHSGPSYQVLIFFDKPDATADTAVHDDSGYVTRFAVFGHGGCFGEEGHCEVVPPVSAFDRNHPHQLEPATRVVTVTEAVKRLVAGGAHTVTVTAVPLVRASALAEESAADDVLSFSQVALHTYH